MNGEQRYPIPLDSPLDINAGDMLVPVNEPKFSYNRQRKIGDAMPTSVRYEDFGWFAGWLKHTFVRDNLHKAAIDLKDATATITPHTIDGLYTYWEVEVTVWEDATQTNFKQKTKFTYLPSSTDMVCLLGDSKEVVRDGDVVTVSGVTNTGDKVSFAFNYKSREFSDVHAFTSDGINETTSSYTLSFKDDEGVDQFNATQASNEQAAVVIIPGQSAQFQDVLLPYTFNIQGTDEHWWGDTFFDVENSTSSNVQVDARHSEIEITGNAKGPYDAEGKKDIVVHDNSLATITWAFLFQDYWTKIEVQSVNALAQYLGDSSASANVLNHTDCSVYKIANSNKFVVQYGVPVWLRHKISFAAERSAQGPLLGSSGTPKPLGDAVWALTFMFNSTTFNKNNNFVTEVQGTGINGEPATFVTASCAGKIDIDWEKEVIINVASPFINKDQYDAGKEPKVCVGGDAAYDPTQNLFSSSATAYKSFLNKYAHTTGASEAVDKNFALLHEGTMRVPAVYAKDNLADFDRVLPRWHTFTARVRLQDAEGNFEGDAGYKDALGVATLRTKNFMPVRYIARKYLKDNNKTYDPRPHLADGTKPDVTYGCTQRSAMNKLSDTLLDLDIVQHSEDGLQKAKEPVRYKTLPRAWACDLVVNLQNVQTDMKNRSREQASAATNDTLFYKYRVGRKEYIVLEEYVLGGSTPAGAIENKNFNPIILNPEIGIGEKGIIDGANDVFRLLDTQKEYDPRPYVKSDSDFVADCSIKNPVYAKPYVENTGSNTTEYAEYLKDKHEVTEFFPYNATVVWVESYAAQARDFLYTSPFFNAVYPSLKAPSTDEVITSHKTLTGVLKQYYAESMVPYAAISVSLNHAQPKDLTIQLSEGSVDTKTFDYVELTALVSENKGTDSIKDENGNPAPMMELSSDDSFTRLERPKYDPKLAVHNVSDIEGVVLNWAVGVGTIQQETTWEQRQIMRRVERRFMWFPVSVEETNFEWKDFGPKVVGKKGDLTFQDTAKQKAVRNNVEIILKYLDSYIEGNKTVPPDIEKATPDGLKPIISDYSMEEVREIRDGVNLFLALFVYCKSNDIDVAGATYKEIVLTNDTGQELPEAEALLKYEDFDHVHVPNAALGSVNEFPVEGSLTGFSITDADNAAAVIGGLVYIGLTLGMYSEWVQWFSRRRLMKREVNTNVTVIFVSCSVGKQEKETPFTKKHLFRVGLGLDQQLLGDAGVNPLLAASGIVRFNSELGTLNGIPGFQGGNCVPLQSSDEKTSSLLQYDMKTLRASIIIPQCIKAYSFTELSLDTAVSALFKRKIPVEGTSYVNVHRDKMPWDFTALEPVTTYHNYIRLADLSPNVTWQYDRANDSVIKVTVSFVKSSENISGTPLYVANVPVVEDVQSVYKDGKTVQSKKVNSIYPAWMLDSTKFAYTSKTMAPLAISAENGVGFQTTIDIGLSRKIASIEGTLRIKNTTPFNARLFDAITLPKYRLPEITEQNYEKLIMNTRAQEIELRLNEATPFITFTYDNFLRAIRRTPEMKIKPGSTNRLFEYKADTFEDTLDSEQTISVEGTRFYDTGDTVTLQKVKLNPVSEGGELISLEKIAPNLSVLWQNGNVIKFKDFDVSGDEKPDNVYGAYNYVSHELSDASYVLQRKVELEDNEAKQKVFLSRINGFVARFNAQGIRDYAKDVSYVGKTTYINGKLKPEAATNELKIKITTG